VIHQSPQPNTCLLLDASQRTNWYVSNRMWHSNPSRLHGMFELLVAPNMCNLMPAVLSQALYDFSAGHKIRYTLFTHLSNRGLRERWVSFVPALSRSRRINKCSNARCEDSTTGILGKQVRYRTALDAVPESLRVETRRARNHGYGRKRQKSLSRPLPLPGLEA